MSKSQVRSLISGGRKSLVPRGGCRSISCCFDFFLCFPPPSPPPSPPPFFSFNCPADFLWLPEVELPAAAFAQFRFTTPRRHASRQLAGDRPFWSRKRLSLLPSKRIVVVVVVFCSASTAAAAAALSLSLVAPFFFFFFFFFSHPFSYPFSSTLLLLS